MKRRSLVLAAASVPATMSSAWAHHGWGSFDQDRPLYLEGKVVSVKWQNPHVELMVEVPPDLKVPADLPKRALPAQTSPVDGAALLAKAALPGRTARQWEFELAPLTRMEAWKIPEIKPGTQVAAVGFGQKEDKEAVIRVEYLFVDGRVYGLRSSPA
ncbi:DUF6152 family protein [Variovorax ureilyticus]|uniref:DUF6152 family protein n=1 Tax=Variovorax ureilyticus TaxID=1836198 RepID=A0ABU8V998_9BURK